MYLPTVLIGRLGRRGTRLVGMQNEVPAAFENEFNFTPKHTAPVRTFVAVVKYWSFCESGH